MIRVLAMCQRVCGWRGVVATGWIESNEREARGLDPRRVRRRGDRVQRRARLRDSICPSCGEVGLERAVPIGQAAEVVRNVERKMQERIDVQRHSDRVRAQAAALRRFQR